MSLGLSVLCVLASDVRLCHDVTMTWVTMSRDMGHRHTAALCDDRIIQNITSCETREIVLISMKDAVLMRILMLFSDVLLCVSKHYFSLSKYQVED